jgi:hypothetical protein
MLYKRFSDFADEPPVLDGAKVKIDQILNTEILVTAYRITDSKYGNGDKGKCLTIQFSSDDQKHIVFTGSKVLIDQIEKYKEEIPFLAAIKKIDRYYTFT